MTKTEYDHLLIVFYIYAIEKRTDNIFQDFISSTSYKICAYSKMDSSNKQFWTGVTKDWKNCGMLRKHLFGSNHR